MLELKFKMRDSEWGQKDAYVECAQNMEVYHDLGENELDVIGEFINNALRLAGYMRKNNYIFMESITEDEYEAIAEFLYDYRNVQKGDETYS